MLHFKSLDGIRGICALLVVITHFNHLVTHRSGTAFFDAAYMFVDFFFVLSGFVIARAYLTKLDNKVGLLQYVIARFGRLYPLYFVTLALCVASRVFESAIAPENGPLLETAFAGPTHAPNTLLAHVFMFQTFGQFDFITWDYPNWSVASEFWTCLIFGLLAFLVPRRLQWLAFALVVVASMAIIAQFDTNDMNITTSLAMFRCMAGFFSGVLSYLLYQKVPAINLPKPAWHIIEAVAAAAVVAFLIYGSKAPTAWAAPGVFSIIVLLFAREGGFISAFLRTSPMQWLGERSYSVYLLHAFVQDLVYDFLNAMTSILHAPLYISASAAPDVAAAWTRWPAGVLLGDFWMVVMIGLVLAGSQITYSRIETPARSWFKSLAQHWLRAKRQPLSYAT